MGAEGELFCLFRLELTQLTGVSPATRQLPIDKGAH
jgi:hypothetical protein